MDTNHKTWLWRKKTTERMIVASDKVDLSPTKNDEEMQTLLTAKAALEKDLKNANDKLSSCLSECNTKDGSIKKHAKMAEEAMAGWENAEAKATALKQELDTVLQQKASGEERLTHLEEALKECMQQLKFVREEQEQRVHDAVMKASAEFDCSEKILEDKLEETNRRNAELVSENSHLSKALLAKEKSIEDLIKQKAQVETDLNALMSRLESTKKENVSLAYEVQVLEKELEIRNEERDFNRKTADASHKQYLESVKKIAKLESECHRLRLLVRKRLPGPAALAKMRSEVNVLGRDSAGRRRTKSGIDGFAADSTDDNSLDTLNKQVNILTEQLCAVEDENNSLKEALNKKANELQVSRSMYARTASKLSQFESHLDELSKGQTIPSKGPSGCAPFEHSHASVSEVGSDDKISCAESWASALISEMEHFKHGKQRGSPSGKTVGSSDISLMDDFTEMERLATVSVKQSGSPHVSRDVTTFIPFENSVKGHISEIKGTEIIPVSEVSSGVSNPEIKSENSFIGKAPVWLNNIMNLVLEQARTTQTKPYDILENVRVALADTSQGHAESFNSKESAKQVDGSDSANVGEQGVSSMKDTIKKHLDLDETRIWIKKHLDLDETRIWIKKHLDLDETRSESEAEVGFINQSQVNKISLLVSDATGLQRSSAKDEFQHVLIDENMKLESDLIHIESAKNDLQWRLQSALDRRESLMSQPQESEQTAAHLQAEVDSLKMSKSVTENPVLAKHLHPQFPAAKAEVNEAHQKLSSFEMELETNSFCDELDATCFELQLQPVSVKKNAVPDKEEEKQLRSDREITAASEKLAECQETILNLGKQLKALAIQNDTSQLDKPISTSAETVAATATATAIATLTTPVTPRKLINQRSSLLDQMLADDKANTRDSDSLSPKMKRSEYDSSVLVPNEAIEPLEKILNTRDSDSLSPKMKQSEYDSSVLVPNEAIEPLEKILFLNGSKHRVNYAATNSLAIVPSKKRGGASLWRKLLWRKRKSNVRRPPLPFAPKHNHTDERIPSLRC